MSLNTDMFLRKILGALATGALVWGNPVSLLNVTNTIWIDIVQGIFSALIGGKVAGFDLNTTWMLRLSLATVIGMVAGGYIGEYLPGYPMQAIGAAAGFMGTSIWPDQHPLFN